jgi:hypothetical protein
MIRKWLDRNEISGISWLGYIEMGGIKVGCFEEKSKRNQLDSWTVPKNNKSSIW